MNTMRTPQHAHPPLWLSWSIWGLGALVYLIGFFQRVAPAVMTRELMSDFSITAAALGNLSAFYFYAYVAMQIPTGILADYWGPRKLLATGALAAGVGSVIFGAADSLFLAGMGRVLIGASVAVAFVALLKVATHWLPPRLFALASGVSLFFGMVGAVGAGTPLRLLVNSFGWRPVMLAAGLVTLLVAVCVWVFMRDDPSERGYQSHLVKSSEGGHQAIGPFSGLAKVFTYRNTWLLFIIPAGVVGPLLAFAGLWGVPYLGVRYGLEPSSAAGICSALLLGWAVGSPLAGSLSDRLGNRKKIYMYGCLICTVLWAVMLYIPLPLYLFTVLIGITGIASGGMIVSFAYGKESVPPPLAGTVSGVINMGTMAGPMVLQPVIGWLLDNNWAGEMAGGARVYPLEAYQTGFIPLMAWSVLACVLLVFTKETHCRQSA